MESKPSNSRFAWVIMFVVLIVAGALVCMYVWGNKKVPANVEIKTDQTDDRASSTDLLHHDPVSNASSSSIAIASSSIPLSTVMVEGLNIPWDIAFLPSDGMLVTEREGTIVHIKPDGTKVVVKVPRPKPKGEGGLLGITLHPKFSQNHFIYIYMTTGETKTSSQNAVFRYIYKDGMLSGEKTIISGIPGALYHDGGRLEFGSDGLLYITTGDATISKLAQDLDSLGGKILRVTDEGVIPESNPYKSAVYSYGHRNPQGLAWDTQGRLWSTEHGRTSGTLSGYDEVNLITIGGNYGWPTIEGSSTKEGMISPVLQSGADDTWAPASLLFYRGRLFFGGLKGESLYEVTISGDKLVDFKKHLFKEFGRIRSVRLGPDDMFYITTSNKDGRGTPKEGDDKIIRINPAFLK
jgi:glucose/arabinose dehydrogenase